MQKKPGSVFCINGLYEDELENLFNTNAESKVANLLFNKIIDAEGEIVLNRDEVLLLKRFFAIEQLRTPDTIGYIKEERDYFKSHSQEHLSRYGYFDNPTSGLSDKEYLTLALRNILEYEGSSMNDLWAWLQKPTTTLVAQKWLRIYNSCYIAFWDSKKSGEDFIITDVGMACEQDTLILSQFGASRIELIEQGFLNYIAQNPNFSKFQKDRAEELACSNGFIPANIYLFSLTATRTIALINPFFRTYDPDDQWQSDYHLPSPDFWPSAFLDKNLVKKNKTIYEDPEKVALQHIFSPNDRYIYPIRDMQLEDVLYCNALMLDRINSLLGFGDSRRIIRSLATYLQGNRPRKDYLGLKKQLEAYGYVLPETQKHKDIANGFVTRPNQEIAKGEKYVKYALRLAGSAGQ